MHMINCSFYFQGLWLLLQNAHNAISVLDSLQKIFSDEEHIDNQFRCWITCEAGVRLPRYVLQTTLKVVIDTPRVCIFLKMLIYPTTYSVSYIVYFSCELTI